MFEGHCARDLSSGVSKAATQQGQGEFMPKPAQPPTPAQEHEFSTSYWPHDPRLHGDGMSRHNEHLEPGHPFFSSFSPCRRPSLRGFSNTEQNCTSCRKALFYFQLNTSLKVNKVSLLTVLLCIHDDSVDPTSLLSLYYMPISCTKCYENVSNAITLVRTF